MNTSLLKWLIMFIFSARLSACAPLRIPLVGMEKQTWSAGAMALAFFLIIFGDFVLSGAGEIDTPISEKKARLAFLFALSGALVFGAGALLTHFAGRWTWTWVGLILAGIQFKSFITGGLRLAEAASGFFPLAVLLALFSIFGPWLLYGLLN